MLALDIQSVPNSLGLGIQPRVKSLRSPCRMTGVTLQGVGLTREGLFEDLYLNLAPAGGRGGARRAGSRAPAAAPPASAEQIVFSESLNLHRRTPDSSKLLYKSRELKSAI
jgi:hypothetical protein